MSSGTVGLLAASGSLAACGSSPTSSKGGVVNVLTWGDPQKAKLLGDAFKEETGITLNMIPGSNDADFWNKARYSGAGTYDTVVTNIGYLPLYVNAGLAEVLDLDEFSSSDELYPQYRTDMRFPYLKAPNRAYGFPDQWGLYGMTYSTVASYQVTPPYSWEALWKAPKGTVMLDGSPSVDLAIAARTLGVPWDKVYSITGDELKMAADRLIQLKPFQMPSDTSAQINDFRVKEVDIGIVYSLGFADNIEAQINQNIARSVVPVEGSVGALDAQILLKGAKNRDNAMKFINFLGSKRAQLIFWDLYKGPTVNKAATDAIIAKGGPDAALIKAQGGDNPELAAAMTEVRQPDDLAAWNQAWDRITA